MTDDDFYELIKAIRHEDLDDIRRLLDADCDINRKGNGGGTLLMNTVADRVFPETVALLLSYGADVNAVDDNGETAVMAAVRSEFGDEQNIALLLAHGADVHARDHNGATALIGAWYYTIDVLMEAGADVNAQDSAGNTALMQACRYGLEESVQALLEYHADPNMKNHEGKTALWFVQKEGLPWLTKLRKSNPEWKIGKIVRSLKQAGANE
jgi:ankyrin repeat protein